MYNTLATLTILALVFTEIYCISWLGDYIKDYLAEKERQRREYYRRKAYAEVNKRLALLRSRQELWDSVTKDLH